MAQKPFIMDAGIKVGDWYFIQTVDGDLQLSSTALANTSQKPFIVDKGFKIGSMAWFETGEDFIATEDDSGLSQRPFLADAGVQVGAWVITQNSNLDIEIGVDLSVLSGLNSSSAISSGTVDTTSYDFSNLSILKVHTNPLGSLSGNSNFGFRTAMNDTMYASYIVDSGSVKREKVYVYDIATQSHILTLDNPGDNGSSFGYAIDMNNTHILVGAYWQFNGGTANGAAYLYDISGNLLQTFMLDANTGLGATETYANFGQSVALTTDYVVIAAHQKDAIGTTTVTGALYVYDYNGNYIRTIWNPNPEATSSNDGFGRTIRAYGNYVLVGAPYEDTLATQSGNVYLYDVSTGNLLHTFNPYVEQPDLPNWGTWVQIGGYYEFDMNDNYIMISASKGNLQRGLIFVYDAATYANVTTIYNPDNSGVSDWFGSALVANNQYMIVGASGYDDGLGTDAGIIYVYDLSDFSVVRTLPNPHVYGMHDQDQFGLSGTVSINNAGNILVGVPYEDMEGYSTSGAVVLYDTGGLGDPEIVDPLTYTWTVTTNVSGNQIEEGNTFTFTVTSDAPDGTLFYVDSTFAYTGTTTVDNDPNYSDFGTLGYYGSLTNGTYTGSVTVTANDGVEDGEIRKIIIRTSAGGATMAESAWITILEPGTAWTAPTAGEQISGGESIWESGVTHAYWYTGASSSTGNPQVVVRIQETWDYDLRRDLSYVLNNLSIGDTVIIDNTTMTVTGNITTELDVNTDYRYYYFDVSVAPGAGQGGIIYLFTIVA